jgi:hypothetical protein
MLHHRHWMRRYWVLGGEYTSTDFDKILPGTEIVVGPLASHELAEQSWRRLSERFRANATMRFSILTERVVSHGP